LISIKAGPRRRVQADAADLTRSPEAVARAAMRGAGSMDPDDDGLTPEAVDAALKQTPRGAFALAGITVGLLMAAWLAVYFLVFLPRGSVG
jgi:hypothetical protein